MGGLQRLRLDGVWHSVRWDDYGYYWLKNEESMAESSREPLWESDTISQRYWNTISSQDMYVIGGYIRPEWSSEWPYEDFNKLVQILKRKADTKWGFWEDGINNVMGIRRMEDGTYKELMKVEIDEDA